MIYTWLATPGRVAHLIDAMSSGEEPTLCNRATVWQTDRMTGRQGLEALRIALRKCRFCEELEPLLLRGVSLEHARRLLFL